MGRVAFCTPVPSREKSRRSAPTVLGRGEERYSPPPPPPTQPHHRRRVERESHNLQSIPATMRSGGPREGRRNRIVVLPKLAAIPGERDQADPGDRAPSMRRVAPTVRLYRQEAQDGGPLTYATEIWKA